MLEKLFDVSEYTDADKLREKMIKSSDYKKLSVYPPLKSVFDDCYDRSVLEADDIDVLKGKMEALHCIMPAAEKLQKAIIGGNAWDLGPEDKPDFSSASSLNAFIDKLVCSDDIDENLHNVTNITENSILKIFDEDTIKDARALIYKADIKTLDKPIDEIIQDVAQAGYYYCVEPSGIYDAKESLNIEIEGLEMQRFIAKRGMGWIKLAKLGIAGLALSAAFYVTRIGMIPDTMDIALLGATAGVSGLYFLLG